MSFNKGIVVAAVSMLTCMLLGGFYTRRVPSWLKWIRYLSFLGYAYENTVITEFTGIKDHRLEVIMFRNINNKKQQQRYNNSITTWLIVRIHTFSRTVNTVRKLCNKLATNRSAVDTHLLAKRNVIRGSIKNNNSTNKLPLLAHYNPGPNYWETSTFMGPYLMDLRLSPLPVRYPNFNIE